VCAEHLQLCEAHALLFDLQRFALLRIHHFSTRTAEEATAMRRPGITDKTSHMQSRKHALAKRRVASMVAIRCIAKVCAGYDRQPTSDFP
jgi:hypothetical protein